MERPNFDDSMFRRMAELAPDAMIAHAQGRVLWANDAAATLMGVESSAAMVGLPVIDFVAPESRPVVMQRVANMLSTGRAEPLLEEVFQKRDGSRVIMEAAALPLGDGVVLVVGRDISQRRNAERERTAAEARARAFFETTTEAMGISHRGVHVQVNPAYAAMFGYEDPKQLVDVPIFDLIDPRDHADIRERVRRRALGEPVDSAYMIIGRRRDGARLLLEVKASTFVDGDDYTIVVMRDITAQRAAETRLAESEQRYRELFDEVPVGVLSVDMSAAKARLVVLNSGAGIGEVRTYLSKHPAEATACSHLVKVSAVNATACRIFGARAAADLVAHLDHGDSLEPSLAVEEFAGLASGASSVATEGWVTTVEGARRWVARRTAIAQGHEHDWSRVVVTMTDLTERRQAREEREALQERLRHAEKLEAIGRLAGGVAHDFNNLLAAIMANTELCLLDASSGPLKESLKTIEEASLRARDLVRQILTFGQKDRPRPEPLDMARVVTDALGLVRAGVPATVTFNTRIHPAGTVLGDRTQVHQIVLNLCANARDAVAGNGHIDVELDWLVAGAEVPELKGRSCARLRVRDDGVGMDEATRARLFEPYMTTRANAGGHGLGLAVVHGIVTSSGGAIAVRSTPGRGSTFDVYFPTTDHVSTVVRAAPAIAGGHERVLLVDDEPLVLSAHQRLLTSMGYQVTVAHDAEEALGLIRAAREPFELVITDHAMPRMSGFDFAQALLAERPSARVLLCTGFSDDVDEPRAKEAGLKGLLLKPISRETLDGAIRRALS